MARPFRQTEYRGFSTVSSSGFTRLFDIDLVKQDLLNHFNTRKNERTRDSSYGSILQDLLFEHQTSLNTKLVVEEVIRIIKTDRRVTITEIEVKEGDYSIEVNCNLFYVGLQVPFEFKLVFDIKNSLIMTPEE
jgi:phage baseplate assembly protein W